MATGVSGYVDFTATKGYTLRVHYLETYDANALKSDVTITKIQVARSQYWEDNHYLDGTISINGIVAVSMSAFQGSHHVYVGPAGSFYDCDGTLGSVSGIVHEANGSKNISITVSVTGHTGSGGNGNGWNATGTATVSLTTILVGYVYIDNGYGFDAYQCFIDNGSGWDQYVPYIDNGSGWDQCG